VSALFAFNQAAAGEDSFQGATVTAADLRRILVEAEGGGVVVARVKATPGSCQGADWGRWTRHPAPRVVTAGPPDKKVAQLALAAFRRSPEYAEVQRAFVLQVKATNSRKGTSPAGIGTTAPRRRWRCGRRRSW